MNKPLKIFTFFATFAVIFFLTTNLFAQKATTSSDSKTPIIPKVIQIDDVKIKEVLKPKGKPLLVNFWATWCVPCREEFPELVEIDKEYKGKIDFITISLDDPAEINRDVPKFLTEMKATMPAYLLRTPDENAVIGSISKDWAGGLPFTVLYDEKGEVAHTKQGKIKIDVVKAKLDKIIVKNELSQNLTEAPEKEQSLSRTLKFTDEDKDLIVRQLLKNDPTIKAYTMAIKSSQTNTSVNLSQENISSKLLTQTSQVKYNFVSSDNIKNYEGKSFIFIKFEKFIIEDPRVLVLFSITHLSRRAVPSKKGITYEFQKKNGEWSGRYIGGYIKN